MNTEKKMWNLISFIQEGFNGYNKLYKLNISESENIEAYGENEFFGWKREAFQDILDFIKKN